MLSAYERHLEAEASPLTSDPVMRRQLLANADQALRDVVDSVRAGEVRVNERNLLLAREIGLSRAVRNTHPRESLQAAIVLVQIALLRAQPHLPPTEEARQIFVIAVLALNNSLIARIQEAATSYIGYLLDKIDEAHVEERRRLARDLHDRVGQELSVAHRQLELYDLQHVAAPMKAASHAALAQAAVQDAMDNLRLVSSELRVDRTVDGFEKALLDYLETAPIHDATVRVRVHGERSWGSQEIQNESFLILREAISNALVHSNPERVLVGVDLAPHELRAWVEDDGCGFDVGRQSSGGGLMSMRERAAALGGTVAVSSQPGRGTRIDLLIPLEGTADERGR